jgi:hypothetical protein
MTEKAARNGRGQEVKQGGITADNHVFRMNILAGNGSLTL